MKRRYVAVVCTEAMDYTAFSKAPPTLKQVSLEQLKQRLT